MRWGETIRVNTKPSRKAKNRDYSLKVGKECIKDRELDIFEHLVYRNDCNTESFQTITLNNTIPISYLQPHIENDYTTAVLNKNEDKAKRLVTHESVSSDG